MSKVIAVYGSLKEGKYNHEHYLHGVDKLGDGIIHGTMYSLGSYPALVKGGNDPHDVEFYEVDDSLYSRIERMEIGAGYDAIEVDFNETTAIVFYSSEDMAERLKDNYKVIRKY